jgi:transposase
LITSTTSSARKGRAYYQRKRAEGKTNREALACLKRRLSDVIYRTLKADLAAHQTDDQPARAMPGGGHEIGTGTRQTA